MHGFTFAIVLYKCVVLGVEFRALNMLSKFCSMTCIQPSCTSSPLHQSGRKALERVMNFAAHSILQCFIRPARLLRHKPSFQANGCFLSSSLMPYAEERACCLPGRLQCCPLVPLNSFKSGLQIQLKIMAQDPMKGRKRLG